MTTIEVFADVRCPFTHVGIRRFLERRDAAGGGPTLVVRAWPLELVNDGPMDPGKIGEEISGLSDAAQGIDTHAQKLVTGIDELVAILPTLQRLTEIVDPLDNTVVRLGRFVDRLPGAGRRAVRPARD